MATRRYRLGVNHHQIPVNAPRCPFHSYHRDGGMRVDGHAGGTLSYVPNSAGEWADNPQAGEPPLPIEDTRRNESAPRAANFSIASLKSKGLIEEIERGTYRLSPKA